jgi:predicted Zn-dependent peptidase
VLDLHTLVGSRYEAREVNGISHFLEHMLHRGTRRYPSAHELALALEERGAALAAATYIDHGVLSTAMPVSSLDSVMPIIGEILREPVYSGIDVEKGIVREEILETLDEDGALVDGDYLMRRHMFGEHALGFPITGTIETLDTFDADLLKAHHRAHYIAESTVLTLAGPLDFDQWLPAAERAFGDLPSGTPPVGSPPPPQTEAHFGYTKYPGSQTSLRVGFRAPSDGDRDEPATELLLRVIDDGMATRLYHQICDARGLCYDVSAGYEAYSDSGLVDFAADTAHERASTVLEELLAVTRSLRDAGPSDAELLKAKARYGWQLEEMQDHAAELSGFFGLAELAGGARTPDERFEQLSCVTREQVQNVAERIFRRENLSAVAVGSLPRKTQELLRKSIENY